MIHDEILHKWINKTISTEELKQFKQRAEYEELLQLYKRTDDIAPPTFDANEMLANILATDKKEAVAEKPKSKVVTFPNWAKFAVAAALIGLMALFFLPFGDGGVEIATKGNETQNIDLPDGSKITLFGDSQIVYDGKKWQEKREVKLTGKAKFEVEKGASFSVLTGMGNVEILGTIFTVNSRNQQFSVSCSEGRVAVSSADKQFLEMIGVDESVAMTPTEMMAKKKNLTKFKNIELADILKEIEHEFEVKFDAKNIDLTQRLTGNFQQEDLEKALKTTIVVLGLKYEIQGEIIVLRN